jgi:hypothetical protein
MTPSVTVSVTGPLLFNVVVPAMDSPLVISLEEIR